MSEPAGSDKTGLAAVGAVALAVACCASGPLVAAVAGSLALGALLGIAAGALVLTAACAAPYLRHRRAS
jgi:hypothetical protein